MLAVQLSDLSLRQQVYNIKQAKRDIDAVYSMGLFDDVNILPSPSEDSNMENPKVRQRRLAPRFLRCTPGRLRLHHKATVLSYCPQPKCQDPQATRQLGGQMLHSTAHRQDTSKQRLPQVRHLTAATCTGVGGPDAEHHGAQDGGPVWRRRHQRAGPCGGRGAGLHRLLLLLAAQPVRPQPEADSDRRARAGVAQCLGSAEVGLEWWQGCVPGLEVAQHAGWKQSSIAQRDCGAVAFSVLSGCCLPFRRKLSLPIGAELLMSRHKLEGHAVVTPPLVVKFTSLVLGVLQLDSLFRINHTDPWVGGDAHRTSRTINLQASVLCLLLRAAIHRASSVPLRECLHVKLDERSRSASTVVTRGTGQR